jgi:hypothetical protein
MEDEVMQEIGKADHGAARLEENRLRVEHAGTVAQKICCPLFLLLSWVIWST